MKETKTVTSDVSALLVENNRLMAENARLMAIIVEQTQVQDRLIDGIKTRMGL